jgi:xanthosine phosphorylase
MNNDKNLPNLSQARAALDIQKRFPHFTPKIGLILGSGLGKLAESIENPMIISFSDLPNFAVSTVQGHAGRLVMGYIKGVPVACYQGRVHLSEGVSLEDMQVFVRTLKWVGCEMVVITNSAGSLDMAAGPGSLMLITDHINLSFKNALVGKNDESIGPRFVPMEDAYDPALRELMLSTAKKHHINLHQGVYMGVLGPSFETPAEIRMFKIMGANAIGMSTVNEVILARHCGLKVVAISAITNYAAGMNPTHLSHEETLHYAGEASFDMIKLIEQFIASFHHD